MQFGEIKGPKMRVEERRRAVRAVRVEERRTYYFIVRFGFDSEVILVVGLCLGLGEIEKEIHEDEFMGSSWTYTGACDAGIAGGSSGDNTAVCGLEHRGVYWMISHIERFGTEKKVRLNLCSSWGKNEESINCM